ncbi:hypothetical protein MPSEU_000972400 [Mayamaea pseudoterrestris]|nr:hypothetical protein MPSEU_000972400 [Mayamaea pseudoterrestris]
MVKQRISSSGDSPTLRRLSLQHGSQSLFLLPRGLMMLFLIINTAGVLAFAPRNIQKQRMSSLSVETGPLSVALDEEVKRQLAKARGLLERANEREASDELAAAAAAAAATSSGKANVNDIDSNDKDENIPVIAPFFFAAMKEPEKRSQVVKSVNENGLITTDGEKMASLSEAESWEIRRLDDVFVSEAAVSSMAGRTLSEKDAAAGIFALRRQLQDSDFARIFDKRNRFIGDLD